MIVPVVLLGYAVVMGTAGGRWLQAARWPARAPRLGIWAWQALSGSTVAAVVLAGATLAVPVLPFGGRAAQLMHACWLAIRDRYSTAAGATVSSIGILVATAILGRLAHHLIRTWRGARRCQRAQRQHLTLLGGLDRRPTSNHVVVTDPRPLVYCLPGRGGIVVQTTAAESLLSGSQLQAVLAHERAHLRERHNLPLLGAAALSAAFPFVPAFRRAEAEIGVLVEMRADDVATAGHPPRVLAEALVLLAASPAPASALGAGGSSALRRCERLLQPRDPLGRRGFAIAVAGLALTMLPMLLAALPAAIAVILDYCPPGA